MPPNNQSCSEVRAETAIALIAVVAVVAGIALITVIDIPGNIGKSILRSYEPNG